MRVRAGVVLPFVYLVGVVSPCVLANSRALTCREVVNHVGVAVLAESHWWCCARACSCRGSCVVAFLSFSFLPSRLVVVLFVWHRRSCRILAATVTVIRAFVPRVCLGGHRALTCRVTVPRQMRGPIVRVPVGVTLPLCIWPVRCRLCVLAIPRALTCRGVANHVGGALLAESRR